MRNSAVDINDSALADATDKYIAGTRFSDTFTGENGVLNSYYFIGSDTNGVAPSDVFNGGNAFNSFSTAIFPDERHNYTITPNAGGYIITNVGDPAHAGTLTVDSNVHALSFAPTHDPQPITANGGKLYASGDLLLVLNDNASIGGSIFGAIAAVVDSGATLEFLNSAGGGVTFLGVGGTLKLDVPNSFGGQVTNFAGNFLDLPGFADSSLSIVYSSGALTISDATHSGGAAAHVNLVGAFSGSAQFQHQSDGQGGVRIGTDLPPLAVTDHFIASADLLNGGFVIIPKSALLANDRDSGFDDSLTIVAVDPSQSLGNVTLENNGNLVYEQPAGAPVLQPGQSAVDQFGYTVRDLAGLTSTANVILTLQAGNQLFGTPNDEIIVGGPISDALFGRPATTFW